MGVFPSDCVKVFDGKTGPADQQPCSANAALASTIDGGAFAALANSTPVSKKAPTERRPRRDRSLVQALLRRHAERQVPPVFGTDLVEYLQKTGEDG